MTPKVSTSFTPHPGPLPQGEREENAMMIVNPPLPFRKRRKSETPVPAALTLVSALYNPGTAIDLTFNRAIDIAAIDVLAITVNDGQFINVVYRGIGTPTLSSPNTVSIGLEET